MIVYISSYYVVYAKIESQSNAEPAGPLIADRFIRTSIESQRKALRDTVRSSTF